MLDRTLLYNIIYALAARGGREKALFGDCFPPSQVAFARSLVGKAFPELWFELPLVGEPWFDLHALASRESLSAVDTFSPEQTGGNPDVFRWFASQRRGVRQLALSWDVSRREIEHPAVQLLLREDAVDLTCGFLEAAGRQDAVPAYRAFHDRLPKGWFACYTGVFPSRQGHNLRVECIPSDELQDAYAADMTVLERHLRQVGLAELGDTLLPRCQMLARLPFKIEFQFDVSPEGTADSTFSASLRFAPLPEYERWNHFDPDGAAGELMGQLEEWGLTDERWRLLADTRFSQRITFGDESSVLYCIPTFVKLRWRDGNPLDAKAYLIAGAE